MKSLCEKGYHGIQGVPLSKDECHTVLEFLLDIEAEKKEEAKLTEEARRKTVKPIEEKKLNLRVLISGFWFLALSKLEPSINWRAMLTAQLEELVGASKKSHPGNGKPNKSNKQKRRGVPSAFTFCNA